MGVYLKIFVRKKINVVYTWSCKIKVDTKKMCLLFLWYNLVKEIKKCKEDQKAVKINIIQKRKKLKVTYDENTEKINITWSKLNTPSGNESFGEFGYNVYYGDVLLGFTTENSYSIEANTNISGTYKVVTTFKNYSGNQSNPATYKFDYKEPKATPSPTPSPSTSPSTSPSPSATTSPSPSSTSKE